MCLYPRLMKNPRYKGGKEFLCDDRRKLYVAVGCGNCYECRKQKAQQWRVRLQEELKVQKHAYFVTLTFSNESLLELSKALNTLECNATAGKGVRRFLERYRKKYGKSLRHWLITELGHEGTERIHLHGVIFSENVISMQELNELWKYGRADTGLYCNERSINYIVKYVTKIDEKHKNYRPDIFASAGIGKSFVTPRNKLMYKYIEGKSREDYRLNNGRQVALPMYYRNKFYTEEEREKLWTDRLDKGSLYVNGIEIKNVNTTEGYAHYMRVLKAQQDWNRSIGYGDTTDKWKEEPYNITFRMLNKMNKNKK